MSVRKMQPGEMDVERVPTKARRSKKTNVSTRGHRVGHRRERDATVRAVATNRPKESQDQYRCQL